MRKTQLGATQKRVLDYLDKFDIFLSVYEIAMDIYRDGEDPPSKSETRSVYECLKRLEKRGLARSQKSHVRDFGDVMVWRSMVDPTRRVLDLGG